jgi:hypothetical protein
MFTGELETSLSGVRGMNNQLKILTAAVLMTATLYSAQAFAAVSDTVHSNTTIATAAAQDIRVADGVDDAYPMDPTGSDAPM